MANVQYFDVILKPVITEKSMADMAEKKYTFLVHPEANKSMVKEAVEKMFEGTKVARVNTMNSIGKKKRRGRTVGTTAKTKKAIVWLTEDSSVKRVENNITHSKGENIMGIKSYNPYTPSRRNMTGSDFSEITKSTPEKSLLASKKKTAGRNNQGKITVRHHGGGNRQKYRLIDFKRNKEGVPAKVIGIEYDPNRTANIALICYADGEKAYILAPQGLTDGMTVMNGAEAEIRVGNCLPLSAIPVGTQVHNIELYPGKGGQMVRSAGNSAQLMAKEGKYATLRLPSGEMRMVPIVCRATIGVVGNGDHNLINLGKAGRKRHMGIRPTVRGSVMNPNDHPHGGGEGRAPVGRPSPMTPWGKPAMGLKTRKKKKQSNKLIIRRRDGKAIK